MSDGFSLDISYSQRADRLHLVFRNGSVAHGYLLTRRLAKRFLESFADLMERTADFAEHDHRAAVIFEHLDAMKPASQGEDAPVKPKSKKRSPDRWALVTSLNIRRSGQRFTMTITDANDQSRDIQITRPEAHRILNAILRKTQVAEWDLEQYLGWLSDVGEAEPHAHGPASLTH